MFKKTIMAEYRDAHGGTDLLPGIQVMYTKVKRPDAIIIMTDGKLNGNTDTSSDSKAQTFMRKHKNKIIWALTSGASMNYIPGFDATAITKKRFIKFKKDGKKG
jgi:Mg-chelatase subunit ChlD